MKKTSYYFVNAITLYRLLTAPVLVFLIAWVQYDVFKWMLALSFFTDAVDGIMARRYKVTSVFGAKLDSVADDFTIIAALVGIFIFKRVFFEQYKSIIFFVFLLFLLQLMVAIIRYWKITSFHTYSAKLATILQAAFMLALFLLPEPVIWLFYLAVAATVINLIEEIILAAILPEWKDNVKGLYWVMKK